MVYYTYKFFVLIVLCSVAPGACWQYFTTIHEWTLQNSIDAPREIHSEYFFGKCSYSTGYIFYAHIHLDHMEVLGKLIVRGWLDIPRIPGCIILRATAFSEDLFRSTAYSFQMCVPRITYCHTHTRFKYHYYEWYIPGDMVGGMNWDIYFYGPPQANWY